jgi:hypothetical protein
MKGRLIGTSVSHVLTGTIRARFPDAGKSQKLFGAVIPTGIMVCERVEIRLFATWTAVEDLSI